MNSVENRRNSAVQQLLALSAYTPWSDLIVAVWSLGKHIWQGLKGGGMYEVLLHEATLELLDPLGSVATLSKSQRVRYLQNNIIAYQDQAWGDGDILLNYQCSPGVEVDRYRSAEMTYILISLRKTKQKGEIDQFEISWDAAAAFTDDKESWVTQVSHRTQQLQLNVIFPAQRPPRTVQFTEQTTKRQQEILADLWVQLADGRWRVTWVIDTVKLHERYKIDWEW